MSMPILWCRYPKALKDEKQFESLAQDMAYNLSCGHFTTCPCQHEPPCSMTKEETEDLQIRLANRIAEIDLPPQHTIKGEQGFVGKPRGYQGDKHV